MDIENMLEHDHRDLDELFARYRRAKNRDPDEADQLFGRFKTHLEHHIEVEEEVFFPAFASALNLPEDVGLTAVLREEHRVIESLLEMIEEKRSRNEDTAEDEKQLLDFLADHNDSEENQLYPQLHTDQIEQPPEEVRSDYDLIVDVENSDLHPSR